MSLRHLIATEETQGTRENDFCYCEGEIVTFGFECEREEVDGDCGCKRSMVGLLTRTGATTMKVEETVRTREQEIEAHKESFIRSGWFIRPEDAEDLQKAAENDVDEIARLCADFELHSVLEKRGKYLRLRQGPEGGE